MTGPSVGVIVPCYRYAHWLEGCVASVLDQREVQVRVLVVDDCSPDDTPEVAARLMQRDGRVEYVRHEENQGLIGTINHGLGWARATDYTVVLSSDDQLVPDSLSRAVSVMETHPNVGLVYGWAQYAPIERPLPMVEGSWRGTKVWRGEDWIGMRCRSGYNCISSPEVVVRTAAHSEAGLYDPACTHTSDLNMWLRIAAVVDVAHIRGIPQAIYRIHSGSMLRTDPSPLLSLRERRIAFDSFFSHCASRVADADRLARLASRALARQALWRASRLVDRGMTAGAGDSAVSELIAFAFDVDPDARRLREWWGLQARRRIGAGRSGWFPPFLATGAAHRLRSNVAMQRMRTRGI